MTNRTWLRSNPGPMWLVLASVLASCASDSDPPQGDAGDSGAGGTVGGAGGATAGRSGGGAQSKGGGTGGAPSAGAGNSPGTGGSGALGGHGGAVGAGADGGDADSNGGEPNGEEGSTVELGAASDYAILAKTGISTVPISAVTGNVGVSPAAASYITGFSLTADPTNVFATSPQVTGQVYAADYATPTPANMTAAVGDMEHAFTDAAGRAPGVTELGAGDIGGMTLAPGVYQWGTGLLIPADITLKGSSKQVWIFQIAEDLTVSSAASVVLSGGALAEHVFWQVSGQVTLGSTAHLEGIVLAKTAITLATGATLNGRLLAQTAVSLDGNAVIEPSR